jgi:septal ring factor EnvC (AmiA/AmiB activator)
MRHNDTYTYLCIGLGKRLFLLAALFSTTVIAQPVGEAKNPEAVSQHLERLEISIQNNEAEVKQLDTKAGKLEALITNNKEKLVKAASQAQRKESELLHLENQLQDLDAQKQKLLEDIKTQHRISGASLAVLGQMARQSKMSVLMNPEGPKQAAQRWAVLKEFIPRAQAKRDQLFKDVTALQELQQKIAHKKQRVSTKIGRLEEDQGWLSYLVEKRKRRFDKIAGAREQKMTETARLAAKSKDFQELLETLKSRTKIKTAAELPARKPGRKPGVRTPTKTQKFARRAPVGKLARGVLVLPAAGPVIERYGQKNEAGGHAKGMKIATRASAVVVSPYAGEVVYAAPFRGYGNLVIIEHGSGYHTLLSGMSRLDTGVGDRLLSGEPVGAMSNAGNNRNLYVEFRKNGRAINIMPWIASTENNTTG